MCNLLRSPVQPGVQCLMSLYAVSQLLKLGQCCRISTCTTAMYFAMYKSRLHAILRLSWVMCR